MLMRSPVAFGLQLSFSELSYVETLLGVLPDMSRSKRGCYRSLDDVNKIYEWLLPKVGAIDPVSMSLSGRCADIGNMLTLLRKRYFLAFRATTPPSDDAHVDMELTLRPKAALLAPGYADASS